MNQNNDTTDRSRRRLLTVRNFGKLLMATGAAGFIAAVIWWYIFFEQMLGVDVKAASECFYRTTVQCEVGNFVGLFLDAPPYEPGLLWTSALVVLIGLLSYALGPET